MSLLDIIIIAAFLVLVLVAKRLGITALSLLGLVGVLIVGRVLKGERSL